MTIGADSYQLVSAQVQFTGKVIQVRSEQVRMPDGTVAVRDVVAHPGAVAVVALDEQEQIVLVHQYRQPVRAFLDELPAGLLDKPGEAPLIAAKRELYEEARLSAGRWDVLVDVLSTPGMTNEAVRIYLARELGDAAGDYGDFRAEHEEVDMTLFRLPLDQAADRVLAGEIRNSLACTGILAAELARGRSWQGLRPADAPWADRDVHTGTVVRPLDI